MTTGTASPDEPRPLVALPGADRPDPRVLAECLRTLGCGYVVHASTGEVVAHNDIALELLGLSSDELLGRTSLDPRWRAVDTNGRRIQGEDHPAMVTLRTKVPVDGFDMGVRRRDGTMTWLRISSRLTRPDDPRAECIAVFTDVTHERARNRALRTTRAGHDLLLHASDPDELMREMCRTIVASGGYALAWVAVARDDTSRRLTIAAAAGDTDYLHDGIANVDPDDPLGRGPVGTAVRERRPVLVNDVMTEPSFGPWRERAEAHGPAGVLAIPLSVNHHRAVLAIHTREARAFDADAEAMLIGLAAALEYGLENIARMEWLNSSLEATVATLATLAETRDAYTAGHQERVADLAVAVGEEMGLGTMALEGLRLGALVHDIGKVGIPAEILSKPGRLEPIEFELIKRHAELGAGILSRGSLPWPVPEIAGQHHERFDRSGYPAGLRGEEIELPARIVAVADVVEAVAHSRPYRIGQGMPAALEIITHGSGTLFDPNVVEACVAVISRGFDFPSGVDDGILAGGDHAVPVA
jgi:putative nucleotidyltransferase with HDIG domain/PAS domain S-box-containing protein